LETELVRREAEVEELESRASRMQGEALENKIALFRQTVEAGFKASMGK
jgi:hypothetical protein